jgi:hypothetical protein
VKGSSGGRANNTCTTRAARADRSGRALPRGAYPDTFPRAPDQPHSPGRGTPPPTAFERAALVVLQVGAIAVVIAAVVYKQFELDRFFVPKELVLHAVATIAALCCLARTES